MTSTEQIGECKQSLCKHQGVFDASMEPVPAVFGSDRLQGQSEAAELGVSSTANGVMMGGSRPAVPAFCGGAGDHVGDDMATTPDFEADDESQTTDSLQGQSALDFVLQNLQCKLGNPKNRCYANAPFRLWMWTGSFLSGPEMWHCTAKEVQATFQADEVVNLTELTALRSLWQKFDDAVQDDASHFLAEMVELAKPDHVITHHFHVDHRQTVHRRKKIPTHLIFENQNRPQEFEELISSTSGQTQQKGRCLMAPGFGWPKLVDTPSLMENGRSTTRSSLFLQFSTCRSHMMAMRRRLNNFQWLHISVIRELRTKVVIFTLFSATEDSFGWLMMDLIQGRFSICKIP